MKVFSWIIWAVLTLLALTFLELNHNTVLGWILFAVLAVGFPPVYRNQRGGRRFTAWILFLILTGAVIFVSQPPVRNVPAVSVKRPEYTSVIHLNDGPVMGVVSEDGETEVFAGIPYAAPPVGELRWKAPQDPEPWHSIRMCDAFAPMSMQSVQPPWFSSLAQIVGYHNLSASLSDNWRPPVSEDSLYVNVWKPRGICEGLPVIVYIHGGSLQTGQPWFDDYSGETFAKNGVITVNMGYRLGVFGFLADASLLEEDGTTGNYGLLDQIKALEWVRDNIAQFGGDPANVTIIGESAGAVCVDALCVSPLARGLFTKAVMESSTVSSPFPPHSYRSLEKALASGKELLAGYGCTSIDELRQIDAAELVGEMDSQHHITPDGYVFTDDPYILRRSGVHNESALLHGFNTGESGPFLLFDKTDLSNYEEKLRRYFGEYTDDVLALYPAYTDKQAAANWAEIYGAIFFSYSHSALNRLAVQNQEPVYAYLFSKTNKRLSDWHSGELPYVFGRIPAKSSLYDAEDRRLSRIMLAYWASFAKTGVPQAEGAPEWPVNSGSDHLMELGDSVQLIDDPYLPLYGIMDRMENFSLK
ncbi:MAG: carboxylesterase family protein [Solobacterium sp.]|nr:carboxylesterase family protein [Solobacterium sp.]